MNYQESTVVIPTLNEAASIGPIAADLNERGYRVLVVDADSSDGTRQIALENGAEVLNKKAKNDLANSVLEGVKRAKTNKVVVMDGDGQHPVDRVDAFAEKLSKSSLVAGFRSEVERWPFHRKALSGGAELLARSMFRECRGVRDPLTGFFGVRKSDFPLKEMRPRGYKIVIEFLVHADVVEEVPYRFLERNGGSSSIGLREVIDFKLHLADLKYRQLKA